MRYLVPLIMILPLVASATEQAHRPLPAPATHSQASAQLDNSVSVTASPSVTVDPAVQSSLQVSTVNFNQPQSQTIKNTPGLFAGGLTSSMDTCLGSTSGGVATPGFGFTLGGTVVDQNCVLRKNVDLLYRMGMTAAALALICGEDETMRRALVQTGYQCPEKQGVGQ